MNIKPIADSVIVRQVEEEAVSPHGIILHLDNSENTGKGVVVAAGPDATEVTEGDVVMFGKYAGSTVNIDGETLLVIQEKDVMAIVG